MDVKFKLIVSIVNKGHCGKVMDASRDAGAEGGTILQGRGAGIHEKAKLFSFTIEPEKDVILTLVPDSLKEKVLKAIVEAGELDQSGKGIAFVLDVEQTVGINHPVLTDTQDED